MVTAGFGPPMPAIKQLQTYVLYRSAIGIGYLLISFFISLRFTILKYIANF